MTSSQPIGPTQTANNATTDTTMEEASSSSPAHALSHSEIELTSRDLHEKDIHTQTPITEILTNMDVDPIITNTDKGKSLETQSATQTNTPNPLQITVLTDIFEQTPQTKQPYNNHNNYGNNNKDLKYDNSYIAPHLDNPQVTDINRSEQRITQLEQQVQSLLQSVKTLQDGKSKVDSTIADIHHNHNLMSSSLNDISTRLDKYDTIIQQLTTNINLLSQEKISEHKERNKHGNTTADDSEQPLATDEDTDAPDEAVMSDGAVFEGIIDELSNTTLTETKFSVKSYNPLNLLPQFNATR
ncbi:18136_t:CDS:2 [Rhizophagus irregularis]|nr:18136_t:CDS:2 [Rhizophagus irregularis]